ncbi:MAG: ABC transporter permease [Bacillota bacterium]|nr:ABC transporter permease [Bacillota bacterium]
MKKRLILNHFRANRLVSMATLIFMAAAALLLGLAVLLFGSLSASIDNLMLTAQTPDYLQMHSGEINAEELSQFSQKRSEVKTLQISTFLNLPNSQLTIGGQALVNNTQDNGLSCQNPLFDFLIDAENRRIQPLPGEVYVPVCYRLEYELQVGDVLGIADQELQIAGFLRDSQMNSMMASSKRFLVHEADYERLRPLGSEEYLIEFQLHEGSDTGSFAAAYGAAGLPANGPTITRPLIKMMNALSDGMMILVILLVSVVVLLISILCIRYLILTQLEKDRREIGMLKSVGIARRDIRSLYFSRYLLLSVMGGLLGVLAAVLIAEPLGAEMRELYGKVGNMSRIYALMFLGALVVEGIILLAVYRTLGRMETLSAVEVLYGRAYAGRQKNLYLPIGIITAAAVFMILVPWNLNTTIAAPEFATHMGIGESQIRIDIRQMDDLDASAERLAKDIERDERVKEHVLLSTRSCRGFLPDGSSCSLLIESGDHSRFPVRYVEGSYPETEADIALSILNAREMKLSTGDTLLVSKDREERQEDAVVARVCGIYSDITNGGKTAKACFRTMNKSAPVMWSVIYLSLRDENLTDSWLEEYQEKYAAFGDGIKIVKIADYLMGTYGQTIFRIRKAAIMTAALACLILFVVVLLFLRLVIWRARNDCSLKKALGFRTAAIRAEYRKRVFVALLVGVGVGIFAGIVPGQQLAAFLLGSMGAYGFRFIVNPMAAFVLIPALVTVAAVLATGISLSEIGRIQASECLGAH